METVCLEGAIVRIGGQKVYLTPTTSGGCLQEDNRQELHPIKLQLLYMECCKVCYQECIYVDIICCHTDV